MYQNTSCSLPLYRAFTYVTFAEERAMRKSKTSVKNITKGMFLQSLLN